MVDPTSRQPLMRSHPLFRSVLVLVATSGMLLVGCSKPVEKAEEIRPVRAMKISEQNAETVAEFSGDVRARVESQLGFRVGGKIVARKVDVGTTVRRGQTLMQLDPQDLQLAQAQASAGLKAAETSRDLARAELKRYQGLREQNFVSQAVLDAKESGFKAAQASYEQALAAYRTQTNQAGYAELRADADGVVTSVDAEVGQVVAAGSPVVRVAQTGEKEIVIGIPENRVDALRRISDVRVRTWASPDQVFPGKLRELAPVADPATRTYAAKIAIPQAPESVRFGMTAYVAFVGANPEKQISLPLTAIFEQQSATSVWLVENGAVRAVPVQVAGTSGNRILVAGGVTPGQTVVTAGVNLLKPGQKVTLLADDPGGAAGGANGAARAGAGK